jgi:hypothetical protein
MAGLWTDLSAKLRKEFIERAAWVILALAAFIASWLWGWFAAGGPARALGAIPSGAVVAFSEPCRRDAGWNEYGEAAGRFVIGVNLTPFSGKPLTRGMEVFG